MKTLLFFQTTLILTTISCFANAQSVDTETGTSSLQSFKKNYLLFNSGRGTDDGGEFKIQISFLTLFKAHEFEDSIWGLGIESEKLLSIGFNYTQTFFNDFGRDSAPVVSTDYLPGLFLSLNSREPAFAGFRQFVFGWEHQSNGEFEGNLNRSWDRGFGELLFGFGQSYQDAQGLANGLTSIKDQRNLKDRQNLHYVRTGANSLNLRLRLTWPLNISDDNHNIRDFYGVYEIEASVRNELHEASLTLSGGHRKRNATIEISSKRIPYLSGLNERANTKYNCQSHTRDGFKQRFVCLARYLVAPFDLVDNHGAWMLQYFNGYGERIRDFDIKENDAVRIGYRFSML